ASAPFSGGEGFAADAAVGELEDVVGAAHLGAGADRGGLPAPEGLAADDGARDGAVDVEVARLDAVGPAGDLTIVEALDPGREAVRCSVGEVDRLVQILRAHETEHGAEAFGDVKERAGADAELDSGRPEVRMLRDLARLEKPLLAGVERGESAGQRLAG